MQHEPNGAPETWAVLGASGFVGRAVVEAAMDRGVSVRPVSAPRLEWTPESADPELLLRAARENHATSLLVEALRGADVCINAAGAASPDAADSVGLRGANALLPVVAAHAAEQAGVRRFIHLSSAAVQGAQRILDDSPRTAPFSPYSRSKACGEIGLRAFTEGRGTGTEVIVIRATSVQGPGRPTTRSLQSIARTPLSSVAHPGTHRSAVSSVAGLARFVSDVAESPRDLGGRILLQPWEGATVRNVLTVAGDRVPARIPQWTATVVVAAGQLIGHAIPKFAGLSRRLEVMWFGQDQEPLFYDDIGSARGREMTDELRRVLSESAGR